MAKSDSLANMRKRRRAETKLRIPAFKRLIGKLMDVVCDKGVEFTDSMLDQAMGIDFAVNDNMRSDAHYVIAAIVSDMLDIPVGECVQLGRSRNRVSYEDDPNKYVMLSLIARHISKFTKSSYLADMKEIFGITEKHVSAHKNGKYFVEKTIRTKLTPEQVQIIAPTIRLKALPKHIYQTGKEVFLEELSELLIYTVVNVNRFSPADKTVLSAYLTRIEVATESIKQAVKNQPNINQF